MYVRTSFICAFAMATCVACGDKGESDDDSGAGKGGGGNGSTAGTTSDAGKGGGGSSGGGNGSTAGTAGTDTSDVTKIYSFDTGTEGFEVKPSGAGEGVDPVPDADIELGHNADEGEPDPGSLQLDIPFSTASQYVSAGVNFESVDLTGKTLKANVKILSGYGDAEDLMTAPANAKLFIKTGEDYVYGSASVANITAIGTWVEISFEPEFPGFKASTAYDVADVREIGVQLDTNSATTTAAPAVVVIDSIRY